MGNETGYAAGLRVPGSPWSNLGLVQSSFAWKRGDRWRASASAVALLNTESGETHSRVRVKEAYAGVTLGDFDLLAGKRILKWSTGYAFTPTGVLDPARNPADPTDRLNLYEGREMVSLEWIKGRHAFTGAWASAGLAQRHRPGMRETWALRYSAFIVGFDTSLIIARDRGRPTFTGANFTRVVGEAVEVHAELAHQRGVSAVLGGKFTTRSGVNLLGEYYSASALDHPLTGLGPQPARRHYAFLNLGKSRLRELPGWKEWDLNAAVLVNATDRSRILIFNATRRFGDHCSANARVQAPAGAKWRSEYGMIPYAAMVTAGFRVQL